MTFQEVKELHEMGFTPEQITQLHLGSEPEPKPEQQPEQQLETKPDPQTEQQTETKPEQQQEKKPDPVSQKLESMEKTINDFIVAMQKNNLKTASVNILPDDQIDNSANTALSELIRPTIKKEEKQ